MKKLAQKIESFAREKKKFEEEGLQLAEASRNAEIATINQKGYHNSVVLRDIGIKPLALAFFSLLFIKAPTIFVLLLGVSFFLAWNGLRKKSQMLRYIPIVKIADLQPGLYQTAGTIDPTVQPFQSWFTNTACFAYKARVEKVFTRRDGDGDTHKTTRIVWQTAEAIDEVSLRDDSGSIPIVFDEGHIDYKQSLRKELLSDHILIEEIIPFVKTTEVVGPVTSSDDVLKFQARADSKDMVHIGATKNDMSKLYKKPMLICLVLAIVFSTIGTGLLVASIADNCSQGSCSFQI